MAFSALQQYLLKECYIKKGGKVERNIFAGFYVKETKVKREAQTKIITKSLERLIDRGMLVGYGVRTPRKWFIKQVRLTAYGKKKWQEWLKRKQKKLPL